MAYQVDKFNGTPLTSVEDGTIDSTTDLRFIGKNYAGYGEVQNENFLHLLENFANTSAPPKTILGQIWYDSGNKKLKFYDGTKFKVAGGAEVSTTAPSNLAIGEFWWDSSSKQLKAWSGTEFVTVGPEASPDLGTSSVVAQVVKDSPGNNNHTILKLIAGGKCVAIINQDDAFTLNSSVNPITDFSVIKKGITLVNTNDSGVSQNNHVFWGSASNALALGGITADQFLQKNAPEPFANEVAFSDNGFTVGDGNDLRIRIENGDEVIVENQLGNAITIRITTPGVTEVSRDVAVFSNTGITPADTNIYSLGTSLSRWSNVYATSMTANTFVGALTGASTGVHTGNVVAVEDSQVLINATTKEIGYNGASIFGNLFGSVSGNVTGTASNASKLVDKTPSITITPGTAEIPIRDASGNIYANRFIGVADKADQVVVSGVYRSSSTAANANTIAARDASGDIYANLFQGTATAARYADLAEKYLADAEYEVGTVVSVGGVAEVTACSWSQRAVGVVSANPAFMMNKDLEGGTYIALKGRVPVKVIGGVRKGDRLVAAADDGCAVVCTPLHETNVFAIALEDSDEAGVKLVEAVVL